MSRDSAFFVPGEQAVLLAQATKEKVALEVTILSEGYVARDSFICPHCGNKHSIAQNPINEGRTFYFTSYAHWRKCCLPVRQECLRKKPKPSSLSFSELLKQANSNLCTKGEDYPF